MNLLRGSFVASRRELPGVFGRPPTECDGIKRQQVPVAYAGILKGPGHYAEGRVLIDGGAINTYIPTRF